MASCLSISYRGIFGEDVDRATAHDGFLVGDPVPTERQVRTHMDGFQGRYDVSGDNGCPWTLGEVNGHSPHVAAATLTTSP